MSRPMSTALATRLLADHLVLLHFVDIELDSGTFRFSDADRPYTVAGNLYIALGQLLGVSAIKETTRLSVQNVALSLSAVDGSILAGFLADNYTNRPARVYFGALDAAGALVVDPIKVVEGRIDSPSINEDPSTGTSVLTANIVNQWGDFERLTGRRTNDNSQKHYFPGDSGFIHASKVNKQILWGSSS